MPKTPRISLTQQGEQLVATARESRLAAQRFRAAVARFGLEMPEHLQRFHDAMLDIRRTARGLEPAVATGAARRLMAAE